MMDVLATMVATLPYSLPVLPFLLIFAGAVALAGKRHGTRGASVAAASFYVISVFVLASVQPMSQAPWKHWLAYCLTAIIPLSFIFLPMLAARNSGWLRGRLVAGLLGAAFATLTFLYVAHSISCGILGDCL